MRASPLRCDRPSHVRPVFPRDQAFAKPRKVLAIAAATMSSLSAEDEDVGLFQTQLLQPNHNGTR